MNCDYGWKEVLLLLTDEIAGAVAGDGVVVWLLAEVLYLLTEVLWLLTNVRAGAVAGDGVVVWLLAEVL